MNQAIEGRELITLDGRGVLLRGTFHRPRGSSSDSEPGASTRNRIGIVFLNSLSLPRAATGDSAVYWAESFADCGYPSFRLDLPGLGDTAGDIPLGVAQLYQCGRIRIDSLRQNRGAGGTFRPIGCRPRRPLRRHSICDLCCSRLCRKM